MDIAHSLNEPLETVYCFLVRLESKGLVEVDVRHKHNAKESRFWVLVKEFE